MNFKDIRDFQKADMHRKITFQEGVIYAMVILAGVIVVNYIFAKTDLGKYHISNGDINPFIECREFGYVRVRQCKCFGIIRQKQGDDRFVCLGIRWATAEDLKNGEPRP